MGEVGRIGNPGIDVSEIAQLLHVCYTSAPRCKPVLVVIVPEMQSYMGMQECFNVHCLMA